MARILFCVDNRWSAATSAVTADSAALNLPAAASQNPDRGYVWRSLSSNNAAGASPYTHSTLDIDLGSVQPASLIAVANPRLLTPTSYMALYERGDGSSPGTANLVGTLPAADAESRVAFLAFGEQSHRHWQLRWTNPDVATGYVEAGYVFLGVPFEPSVNFAVPSQGQIIDPSIPVASVDGQVTVTTRTMFGAQSLLFDFASEADFDALRTLYASVGIRRNFFIVLDSTREWTAQLVRFASALQHTWEQVDGRFSVGLAYEEAR